MRWQGLVFAGLLAAAGCAETAMQKIDRQTSQLIEARVQQTLGPDDSNQFDPRAQTTTTAAPGPRAFERTLSSVNPPPAQLPAQPAASQSAGTLELATTQPAQAAAAATQPAGAVAMGLPEALAYAVRYAPEYRNRKEDLFLTALDLLIQRHLWGPRFFATFTAAVDGTPEQGDYEQALSLVHDLGVTQRLPYGGSISASALVNFLDRLERDSGGGLEREQDVTLDFSARLPLLRGAGLVAQEDLIQAQRNLSYGVRTFSRFRRSFLVTISTNYYDLLQQQMQIENLRRQVENLEWLSSRIEALANAGREPYFEVQRSQQQVLFARNNLLNVIDSYANAVDAFKIRIGMPTDKPLAITPSEVVVPQPALDPVRAVQVALRLRLDLQNARDQLDDARRGVAVARNDLLPGVDLFANLSLPTTASKANAGLDLDAGAGSYSAGVTVDLPVDRRLETIGYRKSLVTLERTQRSLQLAEDQVAQEVRQAVRQLALARSTLELQNRNIEIAQKRLRGVLLRLRSLGPRDFIEAQDDLLEARNRRDAALRDLRVNVLRYLLETGQMRVSADGQWLPPAALARAVSVPASLSPQEILEADAAWRASPNATAPATQPAVSPAAVDDQP